MPRYRKLHTKTVESLDVNDMPDDFTRLLWVLLPLGLCAEGRGVDNARWVQSKIFPLRLDVTLEMVGGALDWLSVRGMIVRYQVNSRDYFYVPTFKAYQGNTIKEAESMYPAPMPQPELALDPGENDPGESGAEVLTNSVPTPDLLPINSATDSIFSIQYSDADSKEIAPGGAAPEPPPPAADSEKPAKTSKRKAGNGKPADPPATSEHQAIFGTLLEVFKIDPNLLTKAQAGRFARLSKKIRDGTYTAADVEGARLFWYGTDWRGKQGSPPANDGQFLEILSRHRTQAAQVQGRRLETVECLPHAPA